MNNIPAGFAVVEPGAGAQNRERAREGISRCVVMHADGGDEPGALIPDQPIGRDAGNRVDSGSDSGATALRRHHDVPGLEHAATLRRAGKRMLTVVKRGRSRGATMHP